MRTALFTGAGASAAIGYSLTRELLPRVRDALEKDELFRHTNGPMRDEEDRVRLHRYLCGLLPGFDEVDKSHLPLITDVFSLVDYSIASGEALPIGSDGELRHCRDLLKQAITQILMSDFDARQAQQAGALTKEQKTLRDFADWVSKQEANLGLITTNYDIGLEYEVYERFGREHLPGKLDLGFDWRDVDTGEERTRPHNPNLRVYKLHGSLDQLRCPLCGYVYFNGFGAIAFQAFRDELSSGNTCHCRDDVRLELHIVSPSLVREVREANLLSVWRSALEWLRQAERWIIVGYSLPPEDLGVRSLLLRAQATARKKPEIIVVQPNSDAESRYRLLFPDCVYEKGGLEAFLPRAS